MRTRCRFVSTCLATGTLVLLVGMTGCGGGGSSTPTPTPTVSVSLGSTSVVVPQDGAAATLTVTISGQSGTPTVSVTGLPTGVTQQFAVAGSGPSGTLTLTSTAAVPSGNSAASVSVSLGGATASQGFTLVSAPVAKASNLIDTTLGVKGKLQQFMATSFQIAEWTGDVFGTGATATAREATLTNLGVQHIRLQAVSQAIPMKANSGTASDWDFTMLDQTVQPVLAAADHSPEFQIAVAPAWMCDSNGHLEIPGHLNDFAAYTANLVRYYNKGGFDVGGTHFQSPSSHSITWWGIHNEFNINGVTADEYVAIYNAVVPAMLAVDPTIKLSALELSDFGLGSGDAGDPMLSLPVFLAPAGSGGVKTQVDVLSTHFYGSCNQTDTDATVFATIPQFVDNVNYFYKQLETRSDLANVQVWVTENNVNADFSNNGKSQCNPGQNFVTDQRGTSAYFAAWRSYAFSQLGKAGNRALYQWDYSGDKQYGEVDSNSNTYLSYWVDRTLANFYPSTVASPGPDILTLNVTDTSSIETLATRASDGTVRVMIVDRAVHSSTDNNGAGDSRTVVVDTSSFGSFTAASLLTIDATTNVANGPTGVGATPATRIPVTLNGYGVAFLTLTP